MNEISWCPGCPNFAILKALNGAISSLIKKGVSRENIVVVSGIGCHAKIVDYLTVNTFYSLHGRPIASAEGIKLGNPKLEVIVCAGDGDVYDEGIAHLLHAAKRNINLTVLIHDNRNFALTTGQFTATSPQGFKGKSTPDGSPEEPFNPLKLMLAANATFIARGYATKINHLEKLIVKAGCHPGFSFIEILQPCLAFFNTFQVYNKKVYELKEKHLTSEKEALKKIEQWSYNQTDAEIPIGLFYQIKKPTYEQKLLGHMIPAQKTLRQSQK